MKRINKTGFTLFSLTLPIFIELFLNTLMGSADTLMLSHYSDDAVAAVGVSNQILFLVLVIFGFVSVGAAILSSQYLGAKDKKSASEVVVISIFCNLIFGLIISLALFIFGKNILSIMDIDKKIMDESYSYLIIAGSFSFLQALLLTIGAIIRSHGFTRDAMYVSVGMNLLHILCNYLFIYGPFGVPVLGVEGVGYSTVISRLLALIVLTVLLFKRIEEPLPFKNLFSLPKYHYKHLLKIGLPAAGEGVSYNLSQFVILYFITLLGTEAITTRIYTQEIMKYIYLLSLSISQGTQIMVGYYVGSKDYDGAYNRCLKSLRIGVIASISVAIITSLVSKNIFSFFTQNENIILLGSTLIFITIILEPGRAFNMVIIGSLRASGDVKFPLIIGLLSMWGVSVLLSYVLGIYFGLGLIGVWISFCCDEWLRGITMLFRWRSKVWTKKSFIN